MKNCTYTVNNTTNNITYDSYAALWNALTDITQWADFDDILYSKTLRQEEQFNKLIALKQEYKPKANASNINGEPDFDNSILSFLDSPDCAINGQRLIVPLSDADYIKAMTQKIMADTSHPRTEQESRAMAEHILLQWRNVIKQDAMLLHQMYTDKVIAQPDKDAADFIDNHKAKIAGTRFNEPLLTQLFEGLRNNFYKREKGKYSDSKVVSNITLSAKINDTAREVVGHVDHLFIGQDGTLHLYLFKTTSELPIHWADIKRTKYKYQLAFLKRMLAYNGIYVNNIDLNIVPVQIIYSNDFKNIDGIKVLNVERYSSRYNSPEYAMAKYDKRVGQMISDHTVPNVISNKVIDKANETNELIFPELNFKREGYLGQSARMWIARAPSIDPTGTEPLVISEDSEGYVVTINGVEHRITSRKERNKNQEIFELVQKHASEFEDYKSYTTQRIKDALRNGFKKGFLSFEGIKRFEAPSRRLSLVFHKYFSEYEEGDEDPVTHVKEKIYDWEMVEDVIDSNVIVFKNKKSGEYDFVVLSAFDINARNTFCKGNHILGSYVGNTDQRRSELSNDWGNIEAIRAMSLINEIIPSLKDAKLGTLHVVSALGENYFRSFNIGQLSRDHYQKILGVVNKENSGVNIANHFIEAEFNNPIDLLMQEYLRATEGQPEYVVNRLAQYGFSELDTTQSKYQQIQTLQHIIQQIFNLSSDLQNPEEFQRALESTTGFKNQLAKLLDLTTKAYSYATGQTVTTMTNLQPLDTHFFTALTVPDPNIQIVVRNLQITHDNIAGEFLKEYDRSMFANYYKQIGYSDAQNFIIGNQASQFKNLYELDVHTGKKTMNFKNPYDYSNDLTSHERELLKQVLYKLTWINTNGNFKFKDWKDPGIAQYVKEHPEYLWVPLLRASQATTVQSKDAVLAKLKNSFKRLRNATERFDEFVNGMTPEERQLFGGDDQNFYKMRLRNPFELSMPGNDMNEVIKSRANLLKKYGPEFFETNVENILVEVLVKHITTTQFNKLITGTKAFLLQLQLTGDFGGNMEVVQKERKWLEDYLKVNTFHVAIMSEQEKKVIGVINPIKHVVTHMLVGGNLVGMVRDTLEGIQQNFLRSVTKLNTDLKPSNVTKAYKMVMVEAMYDRKLAMLLSKLCLKYRISNTDVGRIGERAKTGRTGILNYTNTLYTTLRCPDFANRMTLFVARCLQDGSWDSFSLDKDDNLVYDWKKDARYSIYAQGLKSNPNYKESAARYLSAVRQHNIDHPENPISPDEGLPEPYSNEQVLYIRNLGDNIYGSYDKGKKAMYEHTSYGMVFGMFTSWFNGIINNYFMKAQKNGAFGLLEEQEVDDQGRPLFFDKDYNITTEDTGIKVLKHVPMIVQGIFPTIGTLSKMYVRGNGSPTERIQMLREYLNANAHEKANIHQFLYNLLFWLISSLLIKLANEWYTGYKKNEMKENSLIANLFVEILTKGAVRSAEQYKGPINILQFIGENMNSPTYSQPVQLGKDVLQAMTLDSNAAKRILYDSSGIFRSSRDSWNALLAKE